jgi:hypothetical protein
MLIALYQTGEREMARMVAEGASRQFSPPLSDSNFIFFALDF